MFLEKVLVYLVSALVIIYDTYLNSFTTDLFWLQILGRRVVRLSMNPVSRMIYAECLRMAEIIWVISVTLKMETNVWTGQFILGDPCTPDVSI